MRQYIIRRVLQTIPILFGVSVIIFLIVHSTPGNPYAYLFGPKIDSKVREAAMEKMGLNAPLPLQYVRWAKETLSGNLGYSIQKGVPVADLLQSRMKNTLILTGTAFLLGLVLAIPVGVVSATRQYSALDYSVTTIAFMGISLPSFFTALLAVYLFAVKYPIFPMNGIGTPGAPFSWGDLLYHLALPAITMAIRDVAGLVRFTRSSMLEVLKQDYIRTARSKGLSERVVIYKHALRNSLIPIVTLLGLSLPALFSGSVIFEGIFSWPGMGLLTIEAVSNRDYPILMVTNMVLAFFVVAGNLIADLLYAIVDPRIRYD